MARGAKQKKARQISSERLINEAAKQGKLAQVRRLAEAGVDVNVREDFLGFRPLISASLNGHLNVVKYLLSAGAHVDAVVTHQFANDYIGATALIVACQNGHRKVVEELLKAGADPSKNVSKNESPTPITAAGLVGNLEIVKLLLDKGAMLPRFALYGPTKRGHTEVVRELLKAGADIAFTDVTGRPLVLAACSPPARGEKARRTIAIVKLLVEAGADINAGDLGGDNSLMAAIRRQNEEVAEFLIEAGANVNSRDVSGTTPLHYAILTSQIDLARFLVNAGADPSAKDCEGESPIDLAKKNKEALKVLKEAASARAKM